MELKLKKKKIKERFVSYSTHLCAWVSVRSPLLPASWCLLASMEVGWNGVGGQGPAKPRLH